MSHLSRIGLPLLLLVTAASAQTLAPSHRPTLKPAVQARDMGKVVVRVNGTPLYEHTLNVEMQRIFPFYTVHGSKVPDQYKAEIRQKALDQLVRDELAYQQALRLGVEVPQAKWQKRWAEVRGDFNTEQEFKTVIVREFGSEQAFRKFLRRSMLIEQLWETQVTRKSAVTDAEVAAYYNANKPKFLRPEAIAFQEITIAVKPDASAEDKQKARARAEQVLPKAKAAKNYEEFGLLAEQVSEDDYRVMMGDRRLVHRMAVPPEFQAALTLKEGETSEIVQSPKGFHIIRLNKKIPEKQMTLAESRKGIRETLKNDRMKQRSETFVASLKKNAKVETF